MTIPDLERLAKDWRAATPVDRSPSYVADDLAAGCVTLLARVRELETFVRSVPSHTKHGPMGRGDAGPCSSECVKCRAEALIKEMP